MRVAIIGAGPGGCLAATLLARGGLQVTLVEQHRFPRDKVCGECLSALGAEVLERAGLFERVRLAGAMPMNRAKMYACDGMSAEVRLARPIWGISRMRLDALLLDEAAAAGGRVLQPARCEGVENNRVRVRHLESNRPSELETDLVLLADGKGVFMPGRRSLTEDLGLKAHFIGVELAAGAVHLFGQNGCYGGAAAIEAGSWNVCFSVPKARIAGRRELDLVLAQMLGENVALAVALRRARRVTRWLSSALPRYSVHEDWPEGVIPLGNAAAAIEPIGGEGMGLALRSAELVAMETLSAWREGRPVDAKRLWQKYRELWLVRAMGCRTAALIASAARVAGPAVRIVREWPGVGGAMLPLVGKS